MIFFSYLPQKKINKKNHPQKSFKKCFKKVYLLTYHGNLSWLDFHPHSLFNLTIVLVLGFWDYK